MDWKAKINAAYADAKSIVGGTLQKLGVTPDEAVKAVDELTGAVEPIIELWLTSHGLPAALSAGATHQLLGYLDAAAAGLIQGQRAAAK